MQLPRVRPVYVLGHLVCLTIFVAFIEIAAAHGQGECIIVENADISLESPKSVDDVERSLEQVLRGHQLRAGKNVVISIRSYDAGDGSVDSQSFMKLTANIPKVPVDGKAIHVPTSHFTSGSSGFVHRLDVWRSDDASFELVPVGGNGRSARVSARISAKNSYRGTTKEFEIDMSCVPSWRLLADLTPWQGGEGDIWQAFYPDMH